MSEKPSRIAVVTGELAPELSDGGRRLAAALADRGVDSEPVLWTDESVDWAAYDAVLVRSCWEYADDVARFRALLSELDRAGVPVANPLEAIRWNLHKSYLLALRDRSVSIPPTALVDRGADVSLEGLLDERGWDEAVVKPAVGAMSARVWRTSLAEAADHESRFTALVDDGDVVVQAFVPSITTGERSAVFFGGTYSHAWNSLPVEGDVTEFDGIDADYEPAAPVREDAAAALRAARDALGLDARDLPYARVDYVPRDGGLVLMELELIEPYLGFERGEDAVARFRDALTAFLADRLR